MLSRFCLLSKNSPTPTLFLTDNIKLDGIPTKIKSKMHALFTFFFQVFKGTSYKNLYMQPPVLLGTVDKQLLFVSKPQTISVWKEYQTQNQMKNTCPFYIVFQSRLLIKI